MPTVPTLSIGTDGRVTKAQFPWSLQDRNRASVVNHAGWLIPSSHDDDQERRPQNHATRVIDGDLERG